MHGGSGAVRSHTELVDRARDFPERSGQRRAVLPQKVVQNEAEFSPAQLQGGGPHPLRHNGDCVTRVAHRLVLQRLEVMLSLVFLVAAPINV